MEDSNQFKRTDINELGEFTLIDHLTFDAILKQPSTIKGIGDDAAVIDSGDHFTLVSTDMLVEGIHFDLAYTPLKHLGYKSVIVNLSDIYAMNGIPTQITVSIAISNRFSVEALEELYAGIHLACDLYNVDLVGGDTTSSQKGLIISITAIGEVEKTKVVYRSGANIGDIACVTGSLGGAYLGLQMLEREKQIYQEHPSVQPQLDEHEYLIGRLLKPEARKDAIAYFEENNVIPSSMIDVSDGLSSELFHLARQSGVGFIIDEDMVPIHIDTQKLAIDFGIDPITCALHSGEDYELLFTIKEKDLEAIRMMPDVAIIGEVVSGSEGLHLRTNSGNKHALSAQGWKHFER
ncbi:MAG: thiamine-phosphate kinase [Saprospiraceae bacterium]|nr:thiamine-phosphate kinase [Saprospiraceae bacterium]